MRQCSPRDWHRSPFAAALLRRGLSRFGVRVDSVSQEHRHDSRLHDLSRYLRSAWKLGRGVGDLVSDRRDRAHARDARRHPEEDLRPEDRLLGPAQQRMALRTDATGDELRDSRDGRGEDSCYSDPVLGARTPSPPLTRQIRFHPPQLELGAILPMAPSVSTINSDPLTCPLQGIHSTPLHPTHHRN